MLMTALSLINDLESFQIRYFRNRLFVAVRVIIIQPRLFRERIPF